MQQPTLLRFFQVDFFPLGNSGPSRPIAAAASGKSILQNSCGMLELPLRFFAFCADVESYLRLMECPVHQQLILSR